MKWADEKSWLISKHNHNYKNGDRLILVIGVPPRKQAMRVTGSVDIHTIRCRPWRWHDWVALGYWHTKRRIEKIFMWPDVLLSITRPRMQCTPS